MKNTTIRKPNFAFSLSSLFILLMSFGFLQTGFAQSENHNPNISPDEFTAKGTAVAWEQGSTVPNLKINDIFNKKVELYDLLDKPLVIEFWNLKSPQCAKNKTYLSSFYSQYDINILGVCTDDYIMQIRKHTKDKQLKWLNVQDNMVKFTGQTFAQTYFDQEPKFIIIYPDKTIAEILYNEKAIGKVGVLLQQYFSK